MNNEHINSESVSDFCGCDNSSPPIQSEDLLPKHVDLINDISVMSHAFGIMHILEDLQKRAYNAGLPNDMTASEFMEYIRSLYPEFYKQTKKSV